MATHHLASWVNNLKYTDLPQDVKAAAVRSFYNWAGCAIGGSNHPATTIAVRYLIVPKLSQLLISISA
jgi:aconitate decarboxylase